MPQETPSREEQIARMLERRTGVSRAEAERRAAEIAPEYEAPPAPPPSEPREVPLPAEPPAEHPKPSPSWKVIQERKGDIAAPAPGEIITLQSEGAKLEQLRQRYEQLPRGSQAAEVAYGKYQRHYETEYQPAYAEYQTWEAGQEEVYFSKLKEDMPEMTSQQLATLKGRYRYLKGENLTESDFERQFGHALEGVAQTVGAKRAHAEIAAQIGLREESISGALIGAAEEFQPETKPIIVDVARGFSQPWRGPDVRKMVGRTAKVGGLVVGAFEEPGMWIASLVDPRVARRFKPAVSPISVWTQPEYAHLRPLALPAAAITFPIEMKAMAPITGVVAKPIRWVARKEIAFVTGRKLGRFLPSHLRKIGRQYVRTVPARKAVPHIRATVQAIRAGPDEDILFRIRATAKYKPTGEVKRIPREQIKTMRRLGVELMTPEEYQLLDVTQLRRLPTTTQKLMRPYRPIARRFQPEVYERVAVRVRPTEAFRIRLTKSADEWGELTQIRGTGRFPIEGRVRPFVGRKLVTPEITETQLRQLRSVPRRDILKVYGVREGMERELTRLERTGEFARFGKPKLYTYPGELLPEPIGPWGRSMSETNILFKRPGGVGIYEKGILYKKGIHVATGRAPEDVARTFYHEAGHFGGIRARLMPGKGFAEKVMRSEQLAREYAEERVRERFIPDWAYRIPTEIPEAPPVISKTFRMYRAEAAPKMFRGWRPRAELAQITQLPREEARPVLEWLQERAALTRPSLIAEEAAELAPRRFIRPGVFDVPPTLIEKMPPGLKIPDVLPDLWVPVSAEIPREVSGAVVGARMSAVTALRMRARPALREPVKVGQIPFQQQIGLTGLFPIQKGKEALDVKVAPITATIQVQKMVQPPPPPPQPPIVVPITPRGPPLPSFFLPGAPKARRGKKPRPKEIWRGGRRVRALGDPLKVYFGIKPKRITYRVEYWQKTIGGKIK